MDRLLTLRTTLVGVVLATTALLGCEDERPPPAAVPVSEPEPETNGPTWSETRAIASDPKNAIVQRIDALERFHASPGGARSPNARTAMRWSAALEAKRKLNGAYLATVDELDTLNARAATRRAVRDGSLFEVGEAAVYYGTVRPSHHGRSEEYGVGPVEFRGLAGEDVSVSYRLDFGPSSFRHDLTRAAVLLEGAPDAARENTWSREAQVQAINFLLRRHAGGDVFAEPGRLNRRAVRRLLRTFEESLQDELLQVPLGEAYPVFSSRLEKSIRVYRVLVDDVGREEAKRDYRSALKKHPDAMLDFYARWAKEHELQKRAELEYEWDARNPTGFWMRRMADGTDRMIFATLERVLKRADRTP